MRQALAGGFVGLAIGALILAVGWFFLEEDGGGRARGASRPSYVPVPGVSKPEAMHTVYLNREGAVLTGGKDDSAQNRSGVVRNANRERVVIPPYKGSWRQWNATVECIRDRFEPYDVDIVTRRPVEGRYIMAMIGGEPEDIAPPEELGHDHRLTGLAPFNGRPIEDAIVFAFSYSLRRNVRKVCETAAMEIAHAYGLDHARHCRDLMSYMRPCGRRRFLDEPIPCGEHEERPCKGGGSTQNSHRALLETLGPAPPAEGKPAKRTP